MRLELAFLQKHLTGTTVKCLRGMAFSYACDRDLGALLERRCSNLISLYSNLCDRNNFQLMIV